MYKVKKQGHHWQSLSHLVVRVNFMWHVPNWIDRVEFRFGPGWRGMEHGGDDFAASAAPAFDRKCLQKGREERKK